MGIDMVVLAVIPVVLVVLFVVAVVIFNSLVGKKNQVESVFSTVDVMLRKRYDLIPNLVATVKGYASHERDTLQRITELRERAVSPSVSTGEKIEIDTRLSRMLGGLMARVENYPQLKASENFMHLQRTLTEMEEQISAARRAYNAAVLDYNNAVEMFPSNVAAGMMSYKRRAFFEADAEERGRVEVGGFAPAEKGS
jgi:LemA protein